MLLGHWLKKKSQEKQVESNSPFPSSLPRFYSFLSLAARAALMLAMLLQSSQCRQHCPLTPTQPPATTTSASCPAPLSCPVSGTLLWLFYCCQQDLMAVSTGSAAASHASPAAITPATAPLPADHLRLFSALKQPPNPLDQAWKSGKP